MDVFVEVAAVGGELRMGVAGEGRRVTGRPHLSRTATGRNGV